MEQFVSLTYDDIFITSGLLARMVIPVLKMESHAALCTTQIIPTKWVLMC